MKKYTAADQVITHGTINKKPTDNVDEQKNKTPKINDSNEIATIFIGHGGSKDWYELKIFLEERLKLKVIEFNSISQPGMGIKERLKEMLNEANFAFLVMTAEDEHGDSKLHARPNVVHEIGLFQGKVGFEKAIILKADNCEIFSNIDGLTRLDFPKNKIESLFEKIRCVLEREKIIFSSVSSFQ